MAGCIMPGSPVAIKSLMEATAANKNPKMPFTHARHRYWTLCLAYIAVVALTTRWAVALQANINSIVLEFILVNSC